ncbi:MAG: hypothetical protein QHC91_20760 [Shinella sp.]|nr:hypothetical protein [Shinella sp.]
MTVKKVLRPYTREEVMATLRAKVSNVAPAARSFAPGGLSATSVFANRRASIELAAQKTTGSAPAGQAQPARVFGSDFASKVFAARRGYGSFPKSSAVSRASATTSHDQAQAGGAGGESLITTSIGSEQACGSHPSSQANDISNVVPEVLSTSGSISSPAEASQARAGGRPWDSPAVAETFLGSVCRARWG